MNTPHPASKIEINHRNWRLPKWARNDPRYKDSPANYYKEYIDYVEKFNGAVDRAEKEQKERTEKRQKENEPDNRDITQHIDLL